MKKIAIYFKDDICNYYELHNFIKLLENSFSVNHIKAIFKNINKNNSTCYDINSNKSTSIIRIYDEPETRRLKIEPNVKEMTEGCLNIDVDAMDYLIINTQAIALVNHIFNNFPNWLKKKKIIIIRTQLSYDTFHCVLKKDVIDSPLMKNVYATANPMIFDNNKVWDYGCKENLRFLETLNSYGNLTQMRVWTPQSSPTITKEDFFKKYNLDLSKKIFTIYLQWPKLKNFTTCFTEKNFLENNKLIKKIKTILIKKGYNVVFKAHPFGGMHFQPKFIWGTCWKGTGAKSKCIVSMETMEKLIPQNTFIEMCDCRNIDHYTDLGMIFTNSTFGLHNYLFNIPLLYVSLSIKEYENNYKIRIGKKKNWKTLLYGKILSYDDLSNNTKNVLSTFIQEYGDKPPFRYRKNNPLYGIENLENNVKIFANYIENIIQPKSIN